MSRKDLHGGTKMMRQAFFGTTSPTRMVVHGSILITLICLVGWSTATMVAGAADKIQGTLRIPDVLAVPGHAVRIEAILGYEGLLGQTALGGEPLEFLVEGITVGTALTGGDGRAFFEYAPPRRGNFELLVRVSGSKRVSNAEGKATIASWERRRPILLVEAAALRQASTTPRRVVPSLPLSMGSETSTEVAADAVAELKRLTAYFYNVMYVFWSKEGAGFGQGQQDDPREWMRTHEFPAGLSLQVDPGNDALTTTIAELKKEGWENLKVGIGRTEAFATVLVEHRIKAIIITPSERDPELPRRVKLAKNWKEVRKKL